MLDLSVIILNWNTREDLRRCLHSLSAVASDPARVATETRASHPTATADRHPSTEVIVVDNASSDGSPEMVRQNFPWVKLIENRENVGFSAGNNRGIEVAR